jgi:valyl-tRNA synthetase
MQLNSMTIELFMTTDTLSKQYDPKSIEAQLRENWEAKGYYQPKPADESYCLMLPPPNVTGTLHMGHGFQQTLMDILIRFHRMQGKQTLWQGGTDHAGIATQMIVERQLAEKGIKKHDIGREAFLDKTWEWKEKSAGRISQQIREMGASIDWSRERFTMDDGLQTATKTAFCRLYEEGLIYRGKRLVNWDPKLQTAISDLEVLNVETKGSMWHIRYPLATDPSKHLIVATTRPETIFGDVCVAVHPDDERYKALVGQELKLPLTDRTIPILADTYVDAEFGTGCVKITPAHDFNDYQVGKRHDKPLINILNMDATLNDNVPEKYQGMDRLKARPIIIEDLEALGLIEKIDDHTLQVPTGDRSGETIEPYLTDQWFIKMESLAKPALDALKDGSLKLVPEGWNKTYNQWLENIEDWCISRQLWWGHRVPAYYDDAGNYYVGMDETEVRTKHKLSEAITLHQDDDVLDTWFTSALWPFATLGWPEKTPELKDFYPTQVLVTGFDLIFFWIARMVMFGLHFMDKVPFEKVYIHGLIRDSKGQKMSKSKGNVLDPLDLIHGITLEELTDKRTATMMQPHLKNKIKQQTQKEFPKGIEAYGTDALRFTFCALANTSRNINFDLGRIEGYRNFCNKLYNASRFVLQNIPEETTFTTKPEIINSIDQWVIAELNKTIGECYTHLEDFRFDLLATALYEFTWNIYCDWYLELTKCVLYSDHTTEAEKQSTQYTLLSVLETICRLIHPVMPFITETLWQQLKPLLDLKPESIMLASYPKPDLATNSEEALSEISWLKSVITECRSMRSSLNISPNKPMAVLIHNASAVDKARLDNYKAYLEQLAKIESTTYIDTTNDLPMCASCFIDPMTMYVPLKGLIDLEAEIERNEKAKQKCETEIMKLEKKLGNESYVAKAPTDVVTQSRQDLEDFKSQLEQIQQHLINLNS